ncbi:MAG: hypothetical protein ACI87W_001561 [Halieaceae bacterium]|jgi:hypothetical protein
MGITELAVLRLFHIFALTYWLGGEWGVFHTSKNVINRKLSMEERLRHLETAYRIDIMARSGVILIMPLGMHMGHLWGVQPFGGNFLVAMWVSVAAWLALCWAAFIYRETDTGMKLTIWDERIRFVLIPVLVVCAVSSLLGYGPFNAGNMQKWFSLKIIIYSGMLVIGLYLRFVMREWTDMFRILAEGPNAEVETQLEKELSRSVYVAYLYWVGIGCTAFLGATKFI